MVIITSRVLNSTGIFLKISDDELVTTSLLRRPSTYIQRYYVVRITQAVTSISHILLKNRWELSVWWYLNCAPRCQIERVNDWNYEYLQSALVWSMADVLPFCCARDHQLFTEWCVRCVALSRDSQLTENSCQSPITACAENVWLKLKREVNRWHILRHA